MILLEQQWDYTGSGGYVPIEWWLNYSPNPQTYNGVYSASKAAIWNFTQSLSKEVGKYDINVNAICPAAMDTDLMETVYRERSKYFGYDPDELRKNIKSGYKLPHDLTVKDAANVVVFLAGDKTNMMTGQGVNITGGIEMH